MEKTSILFDKTIYSLFSIILNQKLKKESWINSLTPPMDANDLFDLISLINYLMIFFSFVHKKGALDFSNYSL